MTSESSQTIVVVDDSPTIKKLFERGMRDLDVSLEIFGSANACWKYLQTNKPDLLFLNIKMPGKDGLTLLKEIRELPLHKDTSVVMISSKDYAQDRLIWAPWISSPSPCPFRQYGMWSSNILISIPLIDNNKIL